MLIMDLLLASDCVLWTRFHRMELHGRQCPCKSFRDGLSNTICVLHILIPLYNDDNYNSEFLKIKYNSQELILRMFIISKYPILFTVFYKCISVILVTKLCMIIRAGQWVTNLGTVGNRHGFEFSILLIETARAGRIVFTRLTVYLIVNRISTNRVTISL